jgi:signal transduction histidine kinase
VTDGEPAFLDTLVPIRETLAIAVFIAVAFVLALRVRTVSPLERAVLSPVLGAAVLRFLLFATILAARNTAAPDRLVETLALAGALTLPLIAVAFFVGLLRLRLRTGSALEQINRRMHAPTDPAQLQRLLARTLGDPALRLYLSRTGPAPGWQDAAGRVAGTPEEGPGRSLVRLPARRGAWAAMLDLDEVLGSQPALVEAAAGSVQAMLERQRLTTALQASLEEVDRSRARLLAAGDEERRRIERDLHDGAQQRLIALRIKLGLAEDRLSGSDGGSAELLHDLGEEVDRVIDEIRDLSRGIYPALLADAGPVEALRAAARDSPLPVTVTVTAGELGRVAPEVESAVYFACLEAVQNAVKHADGATRIELRLENGANLRFEVKDDGRAADTAWLTAEGNSGTGLTNIRDRIAALGGEVTIDSRPGAGTTVSGVVPLS